MIIAILPKVVSEFVILSNDLFLWASIFIVLTTRTVSLIQQRKFRYITCIFV